MNLTKRTASIFLFLSLYCAGRCASAEEHHPHPRILGGSTLSTSAAPVVFLWYEGYWCSGVLAGTRSVLTAAHCLQKVPSGSAPLAYIGPRKYQGVSLVRHMNYVQPALDSQGRLLTTRSNSAFDLSVVTLAEDVQGFIPYPVWTGPVSESLPVKIFGFGYNDIPFQSQANYYDRLRVASSAVTDPKDGLLDIEYAANLVLACGGDSGGPMVQTIAGEEMTIGIAALAWYTIGPDNVCKPLTEAPKSSYANVSSESTKQFLLQFPNIIKANAPTIEIYEQVQNIRRLISSKYAHSRRRESVSTRPLAKKLKSLQDLYEVKAFKEVQSKLRNKPTLKPQELNNIVRKILAALNNFSS